MSRVLRVVVSFCAVLSFCAHNFPQPAVVTSPGTNIIAITGATLIDGSGRTPVTNSLVIIKGNSIATVGIAGQARIPHGTRVIDARGLVLAPGFIDSHSHSDRGLDSDPSAKTQGFAGNHHDRRGKRRRLRVSRGRSPAEA